MRDEPYYPDASLWDFLERVLSPCGWPPERVLGAIVEADRVMPEPGDPATNRAVLYHCLGLVTGHPPEFGPFPLPSLTRALAERCMGIRKARRLVNLPFTQRLKALYDLDDGSTWFALSPLIRRLGAGTRVPAGELGRLLVYKGRLYMRTTKSLRNLRLHARECPEKAGDALEAIHFLSVGLREAVQKVRRNATQSRNCPTDLRRRPASTPG